MFERRAIPTVFITTARTPRTSNGNLISESNNNFYKNTRRVRRVPIRTQKLSVRQLMMARARVSQRPGRQCDRAGHRYSGEDLISGLLSFKPQSFIARGQRVIFYFFINSFHYYTRHRYAAGLRVALLLINIYLYKIIFFFFIVFKLFSTTYAAD